MTLQPKEIDFEATFQMFKIHLDSIYRQSKTPIKGMDIFQLTYDCCTAYPQPFSERLLKGILEYLTEYCIDIVNEIINSSTPVAVYANKWKLYSQASTYLNTACEYLNRQLKQKSNLQKSGPVDTILKMSLLSHSHLIWQTNVMLKCKKDCDNLIVSKLLELVRAHRDGKEITGSDVQTTINSLIEMNMHSETPRKLYTEEFETLMLQDTIDYYSQEASLKINTLSINDFIVTAAQRVTEEQDRIALLTPEFSHSKIIQACEHQYIAQHLEPLIKEFTKQIINEQVDNCNFSYRLVSRIPDGIKQPIVVFEQHVMQSLKELVKAARPSTQKEPTSYIDSVIALRDRFITFCSLSFQGDPAFEAAMDKTFRLVLNDADLNPHFQYPEGFSKYCDLLLKKGSKNTLTEIEVETKIKQMLSLFSYLDDKDLFQKFYARLLAKRLLYSTFISIDTEMNIVSRLKELCGYEFTSKMQRMFTDVTLSSELNTEFKKQDLGVECDFNVMVLTTGSWPLPMDTFPDYRLPFAIERGITEFNSFYLTNQGRVGRKLCWNHHFSRGEIRTDFLDKKYEITLSLRQLIVIMPFNNELNYSLSKLSEITGFSETETKRIVKTWCDFGLLIESGTDYQLNLKFQNKRVRLKLPNLAVTDSKEEIQMTKKAVDDDRRFALQAAIVRVMKARQVLSHQGLIEQVIIQSKNQFHPSIPLIKKCIEGLIEKGYIERTTERDQYQYIA